MLPNWQEILFKPLLGLTPSKNYAKGLGGTSEVTEHQGDTAGHQSVLDTSKVSL